MRCYGPWRPPRRVRVARRMVSKVTSVTHAGLLAAGAKARQHVGLAMAGVTGRATGREGAAAHRAAEKCAAPVRGAGTESDQSSRAPTAKVAQVSKRRAASEEAGSGECTKAGEHSAAIIPPIIPVAAEYTPLLPIPGGRATKKAPGAAFSTPGAGTCKTGDYGLKPWIR